MDSYLLCLSCILFLILLYQGLRQYSIISSKMATWHLLSSSYDCVFLRLSETVRQVNEICMSHSLVMCNAAFHLWHSSFPQSNVWGSYQKRQTKKHIIRKEPCRIFAIFNKQKQYVSKKIIKQYQNMLKNLSEKF